MIDRINRLRSLYMDAPTKAIFWERLQLIEAAKKLVVGLDRGTAYANILAYVLDHMTVEIRKDEYIVSTMKQTLMTEAQEKEYAEICKDNCFKLTPLMSFDSLRLTQSIDDPDNIYVPEIFCSYGHNVGDYARVLKLGFNGLAEEARERLADSGLYPTQKTFLQNCITVCEAMTRFGKRYSEAALQMMANAESEEERKRFQVIADTCACSPGYPAKTFRQAVQSVWFFHMVQNALVGCRDYSWGRIDEYLYPYYEADVQAGTLTREEALVIIEEWYIHEAEFSGYVHDAKGAKRIANYSCVQYVVLGGTDVNGKEICNDISYLALEAWADVGDIITPDIIVRWFNGINQDFLDFAVDICARGKGNPAFFNEELIIRGLEEYGIAEKDARTFAFYGCNNVVIPGLEDNLNESWHSGPKYLELALNAGIDPVTKKRIGVATMPPEKMQSIEDVLAAYRAQLRHAFYLARQDHSRCNQIWEAMKPFSYESLFGTDCIRKAASLDSSGSRYKHYNIQYMGIATVADSLYAIDKLVFHDKRFTMRELLDILAKNWEGNEELSAYIRNKLPKYGSDDDSVDRFAACIGEMVIAEADALSDLYNGRKAQVAFYSLMWHRAMGMDVGATPDGRHAYTPYSELISGTYGLERNGPTGALNSAAKLPLYRTPTGAHNVKFQPAAVKGSDGRARLKACMESYFCNGGTQMMVNVMDPETLQKAKAHPDEYQNLMVRVFGFSDYFISLWPDQQDEIIQRDTLVL